MYEAQATNEEFELIKRKCWMPGCKSKAWLEDWTGYRHCLKDWYRSLRWGSGENSKLFYIKTTKIF